MTEPQIELDDISSFQPDQTLVRTQAHWLLIWNLIIIGALLVAFAHPIAVRMFREESDPGIHRWDANQAREIATTIRCLGAMCFGAGLVERVITHLSSRR